VREERILLVRGFDGDDFCTGDQSFDMGIILRMVLPEGSVVKSETDDKGPKLRIQLGTTGISWTDKNDKKNLMEWIVETIRRLLDLQGRYSLRDNGPDALEGIGGSLSFNYEINLAKDEIYIDYWLDDSTR